ncbi:MAG: protein kinase, partial [Planctomycetes bacterium]|nr:protein kinase [Planctomycetota bacterium]
AVKVAKAPEGDSRQSRRLRKLFVNEARAARLLEHPNIVALLDAGYEGDLWYVTMELVEGGRTLDDHCRLPNLLPVGEAVRVLAQCAEALGYAHSRGVVHRDVKPRNVMLTADNQVKVTDFGVALIDRIEDGETTQVIGNIGSPSYMAPEQIRGEPATPQADIFALGLIAYQMLTGEHPFRGRTVPEVARKIASEAQQPLLEIRPELSPLLARVVDHALKKHPAGRYTSAVEMAADLALIAEDLRDSGEGDDGPLRAKLAQVRPLEFFAGFGDDEMLEVLRAGLWQRFASGEAIVVEGESTDAFYVLVEGEARVWRNRRLLDTLVPGNSFGELGFLLHAPRSATIIARGTVTVLKLRAGVIDHTSAGCQIKLQRAFLHTMATRLQRVMDTLAETGG